MAYSVIKKPSDYFNTKLYTGTGASNSITGVGFQPDFTWIKVRSIGFNHRLQDSVRGATKSLYSNLTNAEQTNTDGVLSFDTDGFSLGNDASNGSFNSSGNTFASWNWLADNTSGSSNTDGSITSTVSANTTSGFSIVSYTGTGSNATVGHGIDTPKMIIVKCRSTDYHWGTYHSSIGNGNVIYLNLTNASASGTNFWNSTTPTSSVFNVGTNNAVNQSGQTYVAYCFAEKKGFSKFGSYTGNGSTDGTFVYTGFKPAFVMIKETNTAGTDWRMMDNKRSTFNLVDDRLFPNLSNAESAGDGYDFLSNGFKIRSSGGDFNGSGDNYIYMAFAEEPLVGDNPATAR